MAYVMALHSCGTAISDARFCEGVASPQLAECLQAPTSLQCRLDLYMHASAAPVDVVTCQVQVVSKQRHVDMNMTSALASCHMAAQACAAQHAE